MRNVDQIAAKPPQNISKFEKSAHRCVVFPQCYGVKVGWKRANLFGLLRRADQVISIQPSQAAQCPNDVPDVGTNAEIRYPPNVDGYLHSGDLTTKNAEEDNGKR